MTRNYVELHDELEQLLDDGFVGITAVLKNGNRISGQVVGQETGNRNTLTLLTSNGKSETIDFSDVERFVRLLN